jgi:hypothetical protein
LPQRRLIEPVRTWFGSWWEKRRGSGSSLSG